MLSSQRISFDIPTREAHMTFDPYQAHPLPNTLAEVEGNSVRLRESCHGGNVLTVPISEWPGLVERVDRAIERAKKRVASVKA